jgi:hypothetical protein
LGGRGRRISEFEASLVYKVSSRTARATQRNPVSKNQKKKKKKKKKRMAYQQATMDSAQEQCVQKRPGVVAQAFDPRVQEAEEERISMSLKSV